MLGNVLMGSRCTIDLLGAICLGGARFILLRLSFSFFEDRIFFFA